MTLYHALLLGTLQGVTEFLPVSSSGHLVLAERLLHLNIPAHDMQTLNILLHAGTLLALLIVYAPVWWSLITSPLRGDADNVRRIALLVVATVPGAVAGLLFEEWIAERFQSLLGLGVAFAVTGVVLILGECCTQKKRSLIHRVLHPKFHHSKQLTTRSAFFIGITQALALIPGLSRSGLTISAGRMMGLERKDALDFSFLMATPIIAGATVLSVLDLATGTVALPSLVVVVAGIFSSFFVSLLSILFLRNIVVTKSFTIFAPYLFALAVAVITIHFLQ